MKRGKKIELFLVNGTADSLIIAELSNWNGKAFKLPRIEVASTTRDDIAQAGIYFLFCKEDNGADSVYIGEAENIKERLVQHLRDYQSEKEKYYWNTAVFFTGRDLNKALIRYLENRFVKIAKDCNRYIVLTKNTYQKTVIKESQIAEMEEFMDNVKILINVLGYKVVEPLQKASADSAVAEEDRLSIIKGKASATGIVTPEGFVVFKGSVVNERTSPVIKTLRDKLSAEGKITNLSTTEDILFSSSSAAAAFVLGYSVSGPNEWKANGGRGRSLREIESSATAN